MANAADNFNRANGSINGSTASDAVHVWTTHAGTISINTNRVGSAGGSARASIDPGTANCDIEITRVTIGALGANRIGILFRYVDNDNYWVFGANGSDYTLQRRVAGTTSTITINAQACAALDRMRVHLDGDRVAVYVTPDGGSEIELYNQTGETHNQTATRHGVYSAFSSDWLDDLVITDLAGGDVSEPTFSHTIFRSPIVSIDSKLQESFIQTTIQ